MVRLSWEFGNGNFIKIGQEVFALLNYRQTDRYTCKHTKNMTFQVYEENTIVK